MNKDVIGNHVTKDILLCNDVDMISVCMYKFSLWSICVQGSSLPLQQPTLWCQSLSGTTIHTDKILLVTD